MIRLDINPDIFLPVYLPYVEDYSNRYEVYWGGRGSGKTYFIMQKLVLKGLKERRLIILMRKETNKLKDSVWRELMNCLEGMGIKKFFDINRSEFRATCKINGTEFKCLGLDDSEKIKGFADASDCYLDEATGFSQEDYELIDGTIRSNRYTLPLQIIVSFNPISKMNWVYKYFGFDTNTPPDNTLILKSTYLDNPRMSADYTTRMENLAKTNPVRYRIEALGEFCTLDKLIYNNWVVQPFDHTTLEGIHCTGLDFGFVNDPTALISFIVNDTDKTIHIIDEAYEKNLTNDKIFKLIQSHKLTKSDIIADAAEPKSIEELRKLGLPRIKPCSKGKDSIMMGIQYIQNYKIIVHPRCTNTIMELENYSFKKDKSTGEYVNEPVDQYNHLMDAMRYGIQIVWKPHKLKTISKSLLGL